MKYVYPVIIEKQSDDTFIATAPDLHGVVCGGDNLSSVMEAVTAGCEMWLADAEDEGDPIPAPSSMNDLENNEERTASLIVADTDRYREKNMNYAVKKTLSLPAWMANRAEREGISLSQALQEALRQRFAI